MIASPGDVAEERQVIREMIHEWNDINSARSKVMLTPIGWETHTSPELGKVRISPRCEIIVL